MIIRATADGPIAIRQQDHAAFAAFLLEHWSDHGFPNDADRDRIIAATRDHDDGWIGIDDGPTRDPATGLPLSFASVSPEQAMTIWRAATRELLVKDPWQALMITHHAYSIHELGHKREPEWKEFFTEFARQRAGLRNRLGLAHPDVERAYSYIRMADWFSLRFCMEASLGQEKPETYGGYSFRSDGSVFQFRPYPFDEQGLSYDMQVCRLRPGGYARAADLRAALSRKETLSISLSPLPRSRR